ncbi:MAG TPA: glycosyltransferase family 61 protein [Roseimicrobium sp.]|nr:glycosyltransferase family 61 protein [Roseimicrobium sp.]
MELLLRHLARRVGMRVLKQLRHPALIRAAQTLRNTPPSGEPALPRHAVKTGLDWVVGDRSSNQIKVTPGTPTPVQVHTLDPQIHWRFREAPSLMNADTYLLRLPEGNVVREPGHVVTADQTILGDLSREWYFEAAEHSLLFCRSLPPVRRIPGTSATIAISSGGTYYHWLLESLPRLGILEKAGVPVSSLGKIIMNEGGGAFQGELLDMLGIPESQRLFTGRQTHFQCETLLAPSLPGNVGYTPKWAVDFIRDKLLPKTGASGNPKRIYISRGAARYRKVLNEPEVMDCLAEHGFTPVTLEQLPFAKQVELFAGAEAVVAPHGAGLSNLAFCPHGVKVVEMFAPKYVNPCYGVLSQAVAAEYWYLLGSGERPADGEDPHLVEQSMQIPVQALEQTLKASGLA